MRISMHPKILTLFLMLLAPGSTAFALSEGQGETSAHADNSSIRPLLTDDYETMVEVELTGRRNRILVVHANVNLSTDAQSGPMPQIFGIEIKANGRFVRVGNSAELRRNCTVAGMTDCPTTWTAWLDLDQAEADAPGEYYDKPLVVSLLASENSANTGPFARVNASLSAHLENKLSALSALVDSNGSLNSGIGATNALRKKKGRYIVSFSRSIEDCTYAANLRDTRRGDVRVRRISSDSLDIRTLNKKSKFTDNGFTLHVNCL